AGERVTMVPAPLFFVLCSLFGRFSVLCSLFFVLPRHIMKITRVETFLLRYELPRATGPSIWLYKERESLLVKISTDEGLSGWGETSEIAGARAVIEQVCAPLLLGQNPCEQRRLWRQLWDATLGHGFAVAAVDIALHDLWGQATGQSIGQLYGGALREQVPA